MLTVALTARSTGPIHTNQRALATNVLPTTIPCGVLQLDSGSSDTATWTATSSPYGTGSPFILPANDPNLPTNDPAHPNCVTSSIPQDVQLAPGTKLVIDGSQGPVRIFSHGTGIIVNGGEIRTINTGVTNNGAVNFVSFDAEPDVASWDGITIHASDATHKGDASFSYVTIQHALTAITIDSGATASPDSPDYGLTVANSGIGPSYFDGIDARNTPVLVTGLSDGKFGTVNNIGSQGINVLFDSAPVLHDDALKVTGMTFGSSVPFDETACPPAPQPCVVTGSIGNNAILATLVSGQAQPVVIDSDHFFRAGSFGIDLENASHPQITNNDFDCNGSGSPKPVVTCVPNGILPKFSAIYLNNVTADLLPDTAPNVPATTGVADNVGQQNGLDALVLSGKVTQDLVWKTPTNDPSNPTVNPPHPLGYMVANLAGNGGLEVVGKKLTVHAADVVKVKGGAIVLTNGTLDAASGLDANGVASLVPESFTSMRDNGVGIQACPSVFVQSCPLPVTSNEWIGLDLSGSSAAIDNANILFTTKAVDVSGAPTLIVGPDSGSYGVILTNSRVGPTFSDSVASAGVPMYIALNKFCAINPLTTDPNYGLCIGPGPRNHGINASYSGNPPAAGGLKVRGNDFQGSGDSAVLATNLSGRAVDVELNTVENAGTFGIELDGADNLTLKTNTVTGSGVGNIQAPTTYPAIYLNGVTQADFNLQISGNKGWANGLDAIAFHGATKTALTWRTPANTPSSALPIPLLGYVLDNSLTVNGALTLAPSDLAEVLQGSVTVQGGPLTMNGAVMTSLREGALNLPTCGSIFVSKVSNVCPVPAPGDWGGVVLDPAKANALTGSELRYATTGITMDKPPVTPAPTNLVLAQTSLRNMTGDGITTKSPLSVTQGAFTNLMGHGIAVDLSQAGTGAALTVDRVTISGTGQEGLLATGLAGQIVSITSNTIDHAGADGINLVATDHLTLTSNVVTNGAKTYPAIYLNGFTGPFATIHDNKGARNGLDSLALHGTVTDDLVWRTARATTDPTKLLGYVLDGGLTMQAGHTLTVNAGDIVKVGNGGALNLQGVNLKADDTSSSSQKIFTSLADNTVGVVACPSVLLPGCAAVSNTDWGGIVLSGTGANGTIVNGAVRYATTGISISSGKTSTFASSAFGLVVSRSTIGPTAADGIDATLTPISVTNSTISNVARGISADLANPSANTALRLSGNRFMSTSAEAILGQALAGRPVLITDNRIQGAGTFGIRLLNADQLVLRNNNISGSGTDPSGGSNRYPAIYLKAVSADFVRNVRGNVGSGNGLDALVMDGTIVTDLSWVTPSNSGTTHALGYLLDGGLILQSSTLTVHPGDVVKSLGGPITIDGGSLKAGDTSSTTPKIFTSLKDTSGAAGAAFSCPSVFVSAPQCGSPSPGDWGGLAITDNPAGLKGSGAITYGLINWANTGIALDSGPISASPEASNFRLTVANNSTISNTSVDGINSLDTPFSIDSSTIQSVGAHGIIASFFSPANCPSTPAPCVRLNITHVHVTGTGKDGVIANGLAEQPTVISENTVLNSATYGVRLVGADQVTVVHNDVEQSPAFSGSGLRYPAIYLSAVKADFETTLGSGAMVQGNHGTGNGIDAVVFHGEATKSVNWITATSPGADTMFGYLLDGSLAVDGTLTTKSGDIVKVLNGGIKINLGSLQAVGTIFTSLKDSVVGHGLAACGSVFVPGACPTTATAGDWTGINVDALPSSFMGSGGAILFATTGLTTTSDLDLEDALIQNITGDAVNVKGVATFKRDIFNGIGGTAITSPVGGMLSVDCSSIQGNVTGISSTAAASITQSDVFNNTTYDLIAPAGATADSDWWGSPTGGKFGTTPPGDITNKLTSQQPSLDAGDGGSVQLTDSNSNSANQHFGTGTLTVALNYSRKMNSSIQPVVTFTPDSNSVSGNWIADPVIKHWTGTFALSHTNPPATTDGAKTVQVSAARSCVPEFPAGSNSNLMKAPSAAPAFTTDLTQLAVPLNLAATHPGAASGTLNGSVDPLGWATTAHFQWTDTSNHAHDLALTNASVGNGVGAVSITALLTGLSPSPNTYPFRVVAVSGNGPVTATPDQVLATTGPPTMFVITDPPPPSKEAGAGVLETVSATDTLSQTVGDYTGTVHLTSTDPAATFKLAGSSDPPAAIPADVTFGPSAFGSEQFTVFFNTVGVQTLTAKDTNGLTGSSPPLTITPATASKLVLSGLTGSVAGTAQTATVTAKDAFNNTATGYTGTVHFTSSDGQVGLPLDYTFTVGVGNDNGVHAFTNSVTLKTAGTQSATVTDTVLSGLTSTQSGLVITPAGAATLHVTGLAAGTAGVAQTAMVTARDAFSNTATGYVGTVHLTTTDGLATLPANYTFIGGDNGAHTFTNGVTLKTAGSQTLTATDTVTSTITGQQTVTINPAAAATLQVTGLAAGTAGVAQTATVTALDAFSNTAIGYLGTMHFTTTDGLATLPANYTFVGGDNGVHTFTSGVTLKTAGSQTVTATDTVTLTITGSQTITISPAAAATLQVTGLAAGTAGVVQTATVTAKDAFSNTAIGYLGTVHFTSTDGAAVLPANYIFVAGDNGTHSFPNGVTLKTAGSQTVTATDTVTASITGNQTVTISPAAAATLQVTGLAASTAGVAQTATVTALDAFSNTATGYLGTVHFTSTDGAAVLPANYTFVVGDSGAHTFTNGVTLKTTGSQTVTATDTVTITNTGGETVMISPAAAATLQVSGLAAGTAGVAQTATVTALDAFSNIATGYLGTVHFISTDGQAVLPVNYTFVVGDSGVHGGFGVTFKTAGSQTLTATDTVTLTITGGQTVAIGSAAATTLQVTGLAPGTAGVVQTATVTARDAFSNTATGYLGTVHFTATDGQAVLPANYTFVGGDNGVHSFATGVTLKTAGSQMVTATDTVTASITGGETVTISPAAGATLQVTGLAAGAAGVAQTATVTAKDAFSNTATGYLGTVHFSSSDGQALVPADYAFVGGDNGVHSFTNGVTLKTAGSQSVTATDMVTLTITGGQIVTISPAAAATLQVTGLAAGTAGVAQTATVTVKDAFSNTATGYLGTVHFTSTDVQALLPVNYTFVGGDNGVHSFAGGVTLKTTGSQTVTGTDTVTASITGGQTVTISPAAAASLQLSGLAGGVAGTVQAATVTAKDAFSNTATGYLGMVHFSSTDIQAGLPIDYTFLVGDAGVHTFSVTLKTAATQSVSVTDTISAGLTSTQSGLAITPAAAAMLQVTGLAAGTAGVAQTATVTALDAFNNTATGYVGTVHFTSTDSQAMLPTDYTFVGGDSGVHSFAAGVTLKTAGPQTVTATDVVTLTIAGGQTVTISPAAASKLAFTTLPQTTKFGMVSGVITVTEEDAFGNAVNAAADLPLTLSSSNLTGLFFQTDGVTLLTTPKILMSSSSLSFKYEDTVISTPTLTAHATGLTDGTQVETITA